MSPVRPVFITAPDSTVLNTSNAQASMSFRNPQTVNYAVENRPRESRKSILQTRLNFSTEIQPRQESITPKPEPKDVRNFSERLLTDGQDNRPLNREFSIALDQARGRADQHQQVSPEEILFREQSKHQREPISTIKNQSTTRPSLVRNSETSTTEETPIRQRK